MIARSLYGKAIAVALSVFIAGCGGGGDKNAADPDAGPSSTTPEIVTGARLAEDVPQVAKSLIKTLVGADGDRPYAEGVPQAVGASFESPLTAAVTADNDIVLAAVGGGPDAVLDAQSTAQALVHLLIDMADDSASQSDLLARIQGHAGFVPLTQAVQAALMAGAVPGADPVVLKAAERIAQEVAVAIAEPSSRAAASTAGAPGRVMPQAVAAGDVKGPLPYTILPAPIGKVFVTGGLVNVYNSMPLAWSARSTTHDDKPIAVGGKERVLLPSAGVGEWLAAQLPTWIAPSGQTLAGNDGQAFKLTIEQSDESRLTNTIELVSGAVVWVAGKDALNGPGTCVKELAEAVLNDELSPMVLDQSGEKVAAYWRTAGKSAAKLLANLRNASPRVCPGAVWEERKARLLGRVSSLAARLNLIGRVYSVLDDTAGAVTLSGRLYWFIKNYRESRTVRVCVADGRIDNCARRFEIPARLTLLEGATHVPEVVAYDADDQVTGTPSSIRFTAVGDAFSVDALTGRITAGKKAGEGTILIEDDTTQATGEKNVRVDTGKLSPSTLKMGLNATSSVQVVGSDGGPIISTGVTMGWGIADASIVEFFPTEGGTTKLLRAKAAGKTDVVANNSMSGAFLRAGVEVEGDCPRTGNKLLHQQVSASMPAYAGEPERAVDGLFGQTVNLPDFSGSFTITLAEATCFSELMLQPGMSPDRGNVSLVLAFHAPDGTLRHSESLTLFMQSNVPSTVKLPRPIFGVGRVVVTTVSSPSWVSWVEIEGY